MVASFHFFQVYVDTLTKDDIGVICSATHSEIESGTLRAMIDFNHAVYKQVCLAVITAIVPELHIL